MELGDKVKKMIATGLVGLTLAGFSGCEQQKNQYQARQYNCAADSVEYTKQDSIKTAEQKKMNDMLIWGAAMYIIMDDD